MPLQGICYSLIKSKSVNDRCIVQVETRFNYIPVTDIHVPVKFAVLYALHVVLKNKCLRRKSTNKIIGLTNDIQYLRSQFHWVWNHLKKFCILALITIPYAVRSHFKPFFMFFVCCACTFECAFLSFFCQHECMYHKVDISYLLIIRFNSI